MAPQVKFQPPADESTDMGSTHRTPRESTMDVLQEYEPRPESQDNGQEESQQGTTTAIKEEALDETSRTVHEPLNAEQDAKDAEEIASSMSEAEAEEAKEQKSPEPEKKTPSNKTYEKKKSSDYSLRLHKKVAEIAAKAYSRASEQSNVLSKARLADIALMNFEEIEIGKFLGKGSFSNVHEITRITCPEEDGEETKTSEDCWDPSDKEDEQEDQGGKSLPVRFSAQGSIKVDDPRKLMSMHHRRKDTGTFRYAIKYLKEEIRSNPQKYAIGTADLVVEGMFLASLSHPNIIKVRGLPEGGVQSLYKGSPEGYFLILDRLFDTLSDRVYGEWKRSHLMRVKKKFGVLVDKKDKMDRDKDLLVRLKVAFDISAALKYLHSKRIIYRDLKPENLGFDVRGDIKLFDLGLVKELHPSEMDNRGNWRLSMAGTPRYMAPECGIYQPYNFSADVYSFSMLLWEILTLVKPLKDFTYSRLKNEIFIDGERPPIKQIFNKQLRALVNKGWSQTPKDRPSIDEVYDTLRNEYLKLSTEAPPAEQISHNRRRSTYVAQKFNNVSMRQLMRLNTVENEELNS